MRLRGKRNNVLGFSLFPPYISNLPSVYTSLILLHILQAVHLIMNQNKLQQHSNLSDPLLAFPQELSFQVLFCLSPSGIANSSSISRSWRSVILSNSVLHQVLDLSSFKEDSNSSDILRRFNRLPALSSHRLVTVSLDLSAFWNKEP